MNSDLDRPINIMPSSPEGGGEHDSHNTFGLVILILAIAFGAWFFFFNDRAPEGDVDNNQEVVSENTEDREGFVYVRPDEGVGATETDEAILPFLIVSFENQSTGERGDEIVTCEMNYIDFNKFKCEEELVAPEGQNPKRGLVWVSDRALIEGQDGSSALTADEIYLNGTKLEIADESRPFEAYFEIN